MDNMSIPELLQEAEKWRDRAESEIMRGEVVDACEDILEALKCYEAIVQQLMEQPA